MEVGEPESETSASRIEEILPNCISKNLKTEYRDVAQFGSAPRLGRGGRTFESCHPDHLKKDFQQNVESLFCKNLLLLFIQTILFAHYH